LRNKYLAEGIGTYTITDYDTDYDEDDYPIWTKQ